jgi:hypothetical protein
MELKSLLGWTSAVVLGLLLIQKSCNTKECNDMEVVSHTVDTFYTEGPVHVEYKDSLIPSRVVHDTIPVDVDTAAILGDYFTTRTYDDSVVYDDCKFYVSEEVSMNKLKSRYTSMVAIKESIRTTDVMVRKPKVIVGIGGSLLMNAKEQSMSVDVLLVPRYGRVIPYGGYDVIRKSVRVGAAWRFEFGRKDAYEPSL